MAGGTEGFVCDTDLMLTDTLSRAGAERLGAENGNPAVIWQGGDRIDGELIAADPGVTAVLMEMRGGCKSRVGTARGWAVCCVKVEVVCLFVTAVTLCSVIV